MFFFDGDTEDTVRFAVLSPFFKDQAIISSRWLRVPNIMADRSLLQRDPRQDYGCNSERIVWNSAVFHATCVMIMLYSHPCTLRMMSLARKSLTCHVRGLSFLIKQEGFSHSHSHPLRPTFRSPL